MTLFLVHLSSICSPRAHMAQTIPFIELIYSELVFLRIKDY